MILLVVMLIVFNGCGSTDGAYNLYPKHVINNYTIIHNSKTKTIFDGYLIGIEKKSIYDISDVQSQTCNSDIKNAFTCVYSKWYKNSINTKYSVDKYYKNKLSGTKVMLITHIYDMKKQKPLYDIYINNKNNSVEYSFKQGYKALTKTFLYDLKRKLIKGNYTHIFVVSMGWHNDQNISLQRINRIIANLKEVEKNKYFKPLTIAITWPSSWYDASRSSFKDNVGHLTSYGNKTNDADELGFTLVNTLVNEVIPQSIKPLKQKPKVVLIGHSLGARLLSRALFSQDYLKKLNNEKNVDLFIGLQPAFSIYRFSKGDTRNPPYSNIFRKLPIVLTSSYKDTANNKSKFISVFNAGGKYGLQAAKKDTHTFCTAFWYPNSQTIDNKECLNNYKDKVIVVDVSMILDGCYDKDCVFKVDNHNDVFDIDMANVMKYFLEYKK